MIENLKSYTTHRYERLDTTSKNVIRINFRYSFNSPKTEREVQAIIRKMTSPRNTDTPESLNQQLLGSLKVLEAYEQKVRFYLLQYFFLRNR